MFNLFVIESKRIWRLYRRYPVEALGGLMMMFITFYALFLGAKYLAGSALQFGDRLDGLVVGYGLWSLVLFNLSSTASALQIEAQTGTLEQVSMSGFGLLRVVLIRGFAALGLSLAISAALVGVLLHLTHRTLSFSGLIVLPLITVVGASLGIGLLMAALALVYKRIGQVLRLFQFVLLALVIVPVERWAGPFKAFGVLVPIAPSAGQLRDLMVRGLPFDFGEYGYACVNAAIFFILGVAAFRWADRAARERGLLGQY
jgi:ABC-2 type transport system permease protein